MFVKDKVEVKINNMAFGIAKERYKKLTDNQKKTIAEFDRSNITKGNCETTRYNNAQFLIKFCLEVGKDFEDISKENLLVFLASHHGGSLEVFKEMSKKFLRWCKEEGRPDLPKFYEDIKKNLKACKQPEKLTSDQLITEEEMLKLLGCVNNEPRILKRDQCCIMLM